MTLKQTFIINSDLDMGKGKVAVQVAHGEVFYMERILYNQEGDYKVYSQWRYEYDDLMKKVVLKAPEDEINKIVSKLDNLNIWNYKVYDRGLTQIARDSFTCLVVEPLSEEITNELFGYLKLL